MLHPVECCQGQPRKAGFNRVNVELFCWHWCWHWGLTPLTALTPASAIMKTLSIVKSPFDVG